jgi:excinuclease ABC subunit C
MPPYNILLKDDKQYPYIKVDLRAEFPRFTATRKLARDKYRYFGPITGGSVNDLLEILSAVFPTATCNFNFSRLPKNFRPCLNYHIGKCCAPCAGKISSADYRKIVLGAVDFLSGNDSKVTAVLNEKMLAASENEQYEQALTLRRQIEFINKLQQSRVVVLPRFVSFDIFAICGNDSCTVVNHTMIRGGKVVFSDNHAVTDGSLDTAGTLTSFLVEYVKNVDISGEILVNVAVDAPSLNTVLSEIVGHAVKVAVPKIADKKKLLDMSYRNAVEFLSKSQADHSRVYNSTVGATVELQQLLGLKTLPRRIECYDISNISGVDKVASMVVFVGGKKAAKEYRTFRIKTVEGANDFASMKETLSRRLLRLAADDPAFPRPDLIVVDGGLGQLKYAHEALAEAGFSDIQLVSLAKREELVYTTHSKDPIFLPRNSFALKLLINIRDESHRFAITYFRKLHGKNALKSVLNEIEGVGQKRQIALHRHFKSLDKIKAATIEELAAVTGINKSVAQSIFDYFHEEK